MKQIERDSYNDEIDLVEVSLYLWSKKKLIIFITLISAILSIIFSLSLPNIYKSHALLAPTSMQDSLKSRLGNFASLGSIAGVQLPNEFSVSQEAVARINSFNFFSKNILPNIKLEDIMAVKEWMPKENILIYNKKIYDIENNRWIREVSFPKKIIPSEQEAYIVFKEMLSISEDTKTSFVSISIEHKSPIIAFQWLNIIIKEINESMRMIEVQRAQDSIAYLNEKAKSTTVQSTKDAISNLLQDQIQTLMITSANNEEYVFKVIELPIISEQKSKPSRALICILGTIFGGILSLVVVLLKYRESKINEHEY